jgi:hypothetical protein
LFVQFKLELKQLTAARAVAENNAGSSRRLGDAGAAQRWLVSAKDEKMKHLWYARHGADC